MKGTKQGLREHERQAEKGGWGRGQATVVEKTFSQEKLEAGIERRLKRFVSHGHSGLKSPSKPGISARSR